MRKEAEVAVEIRFCSHGGRLTSLAFCTASLAGFLICGDDLVLILSYSWNKGNKAGGNFRHCGRTSTFIIKKKKKKDQNSTDGQVFYTVRTELAGAMLLKNN